MSRLPTCGNPGQSDESQPDHRLDLAYAVLRTALYSDVTIAGLAALAALTGADVASLAGVAVGAIATVNGAAIGVASAALRRLPRSTRG